MPDLALRDALELVFAVVLAGQRARPALTPPPSLKPFLRFQKLPPAALGPVRRAVEADDDLRRRAAQIATEELVGRAGLLWLQRPEGWAADLEQLVGEEEAAERAAEEDREERSARRRLEAAEQAARKTAAEAAALRVEAGAERDQRAQTEKERARLERKAHQLEVELGGARRRLDDADARAAAAEAALGPLQEALEQLRTERDELATSIEASAAPTVEAAASTVEAPADGQEHDPSRQPPAAADVAGAERGEDSGTPPAEPAVRPTRARRGEAATRLAIALAEAADATARLTEALASAASAVRDATRQEPPVEPVPGVAAGTSPRRRGRRPRRVPLSLPGGVWADAPEAALHLVKAPNLLLVVDGYNVAKLGWPGLELADQRVRVLDALDELAARHGTEVHVVFDGADVGPIPSGRRYLRVEFSPAGVKADEVIVRKVEELPIDRPVAVATNDGEVRAGARAAGANIISSDQLLAVARR